MRTALRTQLRTQLSPLRALGLTALLLQTSLACESSQVEPRVPEVIEAEASARPPRWELIWSDEFDAPEGTAIDSTKWVHDTGGHGWGNAQLEFNSDRTSNVSHNGEGQLAITARREPLNGLEYSSGRVKTQGRFELQYGRVEALIKLPTGQGIWPAFWMLGADFPSVGWPDCGEIDIMEHRGQLRYESTGAVHGPGFSAGEAISGRQSSSEALSDDFHLFALEWTSSELRWFVDDQQFMSLSAEQLPKRSAWPFDKPYFLLMNVAVGGHYVGAPNEQTSFPQSMLIDYVRVYRDLNSSRGAQ